jgi:hypothetical protein
MFSMVPQPLLAQSSIAATKIIVPVRRIEASPIDIAGASYTRIARLEQYTFDRRGSQDCPSARIAKKVGSLAAGALGCIAAATP